MDLRRIQREIDEMGFSIVENIVNKEEVEILRSRLQEALEEDAKEYGHLDGKRYNHIVDLTTRGPAFVRLLENEKMLSIFSHFLGSDCILYSYTSTIFLPNDKPDVSNIHRVSKKYPYIDGYYLGLLMNLALDDYTEENGATYYLPGSHKMQGVPTEEEFFSNSVRAIRKAGDAIFSHPLCYRAGGINETEKASYAIAPYACRAFIKQRLDYPRIATPEVLSWLGSKGRSFLGFEARVPTNLFEYYFPKEKRLYKTSSD